MKVSAAAVCFVALVLTVTGCSTTPPKDASPVVVLTGAPSAPTPTETESSAEPTDVPTTVDPSDEPTFTEPSPEPTVTAETDGSTGQDDFLIPEEDVLFTADELYSSTIEDLYADVEAADRSNRIGICRSAAIVVGDLTSAQIEERRDAMAPDDVETLEDFVSLCQRVLAS